MFIARYKNGKTVTEKQSHWKGLVDGIIQVDLTFPIPVTYRDKKTGRTMKAPDRTISLKGYDQYYFHNEAVAHLDVNSGKITDDGQGKIVAKAIGGIRNGQVTEVRVDKGGFCQVIVFDEKDFKHRDIKKAD